MLDISFIRQNVDIIAMAALRRGIHVDTKTLLSLDDERRAFPKEAHTSEAYATCMKAWRACMLTIPNIPDISTPQETALLEQPQKSVPAWNTAWICTQREAALVTTPFGTAVNASVRAYIETLFRTAHFTHRHVYMPAHELSHYMLLERPQLQEKCVCSATIPESVVIHGAPRDTYATIEMVEGSHMHSVDAFERTRQFFQEHMTALQIPYTVQSVGVKDMPLSVVKMYRFTLVQGDTPLPLLEITYEHDYLARQYGCMYDDAGRRRYLHTVRTTIPDALAWTVGMLVGSLEGATVTLPPALASYTTYTTHTFA